MSTKNWQIHCESARAARGRSAGAPLHAQLPSASRQTTRCLNLSLVGFRSTRLCRFRASHGCRHRAVLASSGGSPTRRLPRRIGSAVVLCVLNLAASSSLLSPAATRRHTGNRILLTIHSFIRPFIYPSIPSFVPPPILVHPLSTPDETHARATNGQDAVAASDAPGLPGQSRHPRRDPVLLVVGGPEPGCQPHRRLLLPDHGRHEEGLAAGAGHCQRTDGPAGRPDPRGQGRRRRRRRGRQEGRGRDAGPTQAGRAEGQG